MYEDEKEYSTNYLLVRATNFDDLERMVNALIQDRYMPCGSIALVTWSDNSVSMAQPMLRKTLKLKG